MLLINISTDKVYINDGNRQAILARNGIEDILWPTLIDRYQQTPFSEIFLINGPGGFTNLRVGTLMLNMLNAVAEHHIQIFSVDKLTLFARLVSQNVLPPLGVIYLGQKHNVWLTDFSKKTPQTTEIKITDIPANAFLDEVYDPYRPEGIENMLHITNEKDKIFVTYQDKKQAITPQELKVKPVVHVEAKYMIEPVLN